MHSRQRSAALPCSRGARVYGYDFNSARFLDALKSINADYAEIEAYAVNGLAIESLFLKRTIASLSSVLGTVVAKLAGAYGSGVVSADPQHQPHPAKELR